MTSIATFGAGCFWGTEQAFRQLTGVTHTSVGYMGGHFENPCYLDVLSRITGHAEVAQISYDPAVISYETLLATFWQIHDPTSFHRQGADRGEQYRSVIFYHTDEQRQWAHQSKQSMASHYPKPIVTEIVAASAYWLATEEHQQYFEKKTARKLL
ncbi:peptide-methionine (S)-S-oxide reductase MsrA [Leptothoe sp. PORK10 BA2]|uniref:peptide-methionine (S)-S-oxide reductase MsrA n=1 Tax=Leptothoe sp. PORK10 BA2 TaxID=3110254 RepID=UPI002B20BF76|nr:peptide-methionine (S)-S-oxide reductase MsrA [Leptothoe sp. PORK10 BA2]MEA5465684.1 peptide-methionine (S)-S-oxide reductase MsrA [Leptothoe sp. PORK10 BA2]